jgi:hypothetical protein
MAVEYLRSAAGLVRCAEEPETWDLLLDGERRPNRVSVSLIFHIAAPVAVPRSELRASGWVGMDFSC